MRNYPQKELLYNSLSITMGKEINVNLNSYMGKHVIVKLNANRLVDGILRGYDQMMNIFLEEAYEVKSETEKQEMGQVVGTY